MKIKDIMDFAVREGISADPRPEDDIKKLLNEKKKEYEKLDKEKKELYDINSLENPYPDSRIICGDPSHEVDELWVGIDIDTSQLLLVKKVTENSNKNPLVISHHPLGRSYSNFYEVMDMQSDILAGMGVAQSVAESITRKRKEEVARKVSGANHFKDQDAARILNIPLLSIHTPADNHVKQYLDELFKKENPYKLKDAVELLIKIPEYRKSAMNGQPPKILTGSEDNKCGKIFVDMTGGTENDAKLLNKLVSSGVSTVIAMHMSEKHYKISQDLNINVIIAGHIDSDNLGLNILLDKLIVESGKIDINDFAGFVRIERNG